VIQRALVLNRDEVLRLPGPLVVETGPGPVAADDAGRSLADQVRDLKIRLIRSALDASGGNQRLAAERLGLLRQSLTRMIKDLGLQEARGRAADGGGTASRSSIRSARTGDG
jgi:DNA-binding NtrC family response regulator